MDLKKEYFEIYGPNDITAYRSSKLLENMEQAGNKRPAAVKKLETS
jgi:hypothetical protein